MLTRSEVRANRLKWAEFLMEPERKKAVGRLDVGDGSRCCLGHGCFVLGIPSKVYKDGVCYDNLGKTAPSSFVNMVGLRNGEGSSLIGIGIQNSLAGLNDDTNATPQEIGKFLLDCIEGGDGTPFLPLSDFPTGS